MERMTVSEAQRILIVHWLAKASRNAICGALDKEDVFHEW